MGGSWPLHERDRSLQRRIRPFSARRKRPRLPNLHFSARYAVEENAMKKLTNCSSRLSAIVCLSLVVCVTAWSQEPVDGKAVEILRKHGLENSQVMDHLSWICDVHGPRLTGSPNLARAQKWALATFENWGFANPHLEAWGPFGKGWQLDDFSMRVVGENPWPVLAWPKAWSPSLPGPVEGEAVMVGDLTREELEALDLEGKIVLIQSTRKVNEPFEPDAKRHDATSLLALADGTRASRRANRRSAPAGDSRRTFMRRGAVLETIWKKGPLAILDRGSKGDYGTIFVSSCSIPTPQGTPRNERPRPWAPKGHKVIPQMTLAVEHYNRICRMLKKGVKVRLALALKTTFNDDDPMQYNVLAEIPGTDPKIGDEVVMLGAHFDSWHSGTGATDNGCGSAVMMEAMRLIDTLIKETGVKPRRTIRVALWSGEEQGLIGSRAYASQHFAKSGGRGRPPEAVLPEHAKLSGYYNLDNGTGRIRGVYLQGNEGVAPIFRAWLKPFHDLDASTITLSNTGGTDHQAFDGVGLPGFQFIQDTVSYGPRTHHSNMDNWDHAIEADMKQAATIAASFAWHTSQRDEMLPRKPMPKPREGRPGRRN